MTNGKDKAHFSSKIPVISLRKGDPKPPTPLPLRNIKMAPNTYISKVRYYTNYVFLFAIDHLLFR